MIDKAVEHANPLAEFVGRQTNNLASSGRNLLRNEDIHRSTIEDLKGLGNPFNDSTNGDIATALINGDHDLHRVITCGPKPRNHRLDDSFGVRAPTLCDPFLLDDRQAFPQHGAQHIKRYIAFLS